jgi:hypothetical protein
VRAFFSLVGEADQDADEKGRDWRYHMPDHVFMVLVEPAAGVSAEEFDRWLGIHVRQVLALPGWVAAERSTLTFVLSNSGDVVPWSHLVRYEVEGSAEVAWDHLRTARASGTLHYPDWYPGTTSAGWESASVEGRIVEDKSYVSPITE